jgi:hypothetical protein
MTPNEKAKDLINKLQCEVWVDLSAENCGEIHALITKRASIIVVDEYLTSGVKYVSAPLRDSYLEYWQKVKYEIENM